MFETNDETEEAHVHQWEPVHGATRSTNEATEGARVHQWGPEHGAMESTNEDNRGSSCPPMGAGA